MVRLSFLEMVVFSEYLLCRVVEPTHIIPYRKKKKTRAADDDNH